MKEIKEMTKKELLEVAKEYEIVGRWDMNKQQLIEAIEGTISMIEMLDDRDIAFDSDCIINEESETQSEGLQKVMTTQDYLDAVEYGTLVAFKRRKENVAMSGKYVGRKGEKILVESKRGTQYELHPECIIWVKTGMRWPKWVHSLFNNPPKEVKD
jgi:hypothetical protein